MGTRIHFFPMTCLLLFIAGPLDAMEHGCETLLQVYIDYCLVTCQSKYRRISLSYRGRTEINSVKRIAYRENGPQNGTKYTIA